jgi:hypothetical protein
MGVVQILEASSESLRLGGAPVSLGLAGHPRAKAFTSQAEDRRGPFGASLGSSPLMPAMKGPANA